MAKKETHTSENAKLYELGFHLLPTIVENKVAEAFSNVTGIISNNNGKVVKSGDPKAIKLAYTITKKINTQNERFKSAYFAWIKFEASSSDVEKIKVEMKSNEDILRFILVKTVDDDEHSTIKLVNEETTKEEGLEDADESEMDSEEVIDTSVKSEDEAEEAISQDAKTAIEEDATIAIDEADSETISDDVMNEEIPVAEEEKEEIEVLAEVEKSKKDIDKIDEVLDELVK